MFGSKKRREQAHQKEMALLAEDTRKLQLMADAGMARLNAAKALEDKGAGYLIMHEVSVEAEKQIEDFKKEVASRFDFKFSTLNKVLLTGAVLSMPALFLVDMGILQMSMMYFAGGGIASTVGGAGSVIHSDRTYEQKTKNALDQSAAAIDLLEAVSKSAKAEMTILLKSPEEIARSSCFDKVLDTDSKLQKFFERAAVKKRLLAENQLDAGIDKGALQKIRRITPPGNEAS